MHSPHEDPDELASEGLSEDDDDEEDASYSLPDNSQESLRVGLLSEGHRMSHQVQNPRNRGPAVSYSYVPPSAQIMPNSGMSAAPLAPPRVQAIENTVDGRAHSSARLLDPQAYQNQRMSRFPAAAQLSDSMSALRRQGNQGQHARLADGASGAETSNLPRPRWAREDRSGEGVAGRRGLGHSTAGTQYTSLLDLERTTPGRSQFSASRGEEPAERSMRFGARHRVASQQPKSSIRPASHSGQRVAKGLRYAQSVQSSQVDGWAWMCGEFLTLWIRQLFWLRGTCV